MTTVLTQLQWAEARLPRATKAMKRDLRNLTTRELKQVLRAVYAIQGRLYDSLDAVEGELYMRTDVRTGKLL